MSGSNHEQLGCFMIATLKYAPAHAEMMFGSDKKWGLRIWAVWCYSGNWVYHIQPLHAFTHLLVALVTSKLHWATDHEEQGDRSHDSPPPLLHQRCRSYRSSSAPRRAEQVTSWCPAIHVAWRCNVGFKGTQSVWDPTRAKHCYLMVTPSWSLVLVLLWWKRIPSPHLNKLKKKNERKEKQLCHVWHHSW